MQYMLCNCIISACEAKHTDQERCSVEKKNIPTRRKTLGNFRADEKARGRDASKEPIKNSEIAECPRSCAMSYKTSAKL